MKWLLLGISALFLISLYALVAVQTRNDRSDLCGPTVNERLRNYFEISEVRPKQVTNNTDGPIGWVSSRAMMNIGDHAIEWIHNVNGQDEESFLKINGDLITLNEDLQVYAAEGISRDEPLATGQWDQIKLYELPDHELIGITMRLTTCTGLSCSAATQLLYDVKTKQITVFSTFRSDEDVRIFRFPSDESFYYVSKRSDGDPHGVTSPWVMTYELHKLNPDGSFVMQKDAKGESYFIKHTISPDREFRDGELRQIDAALPDTLEQRWIGDID